MNEDIIDNKINSELDERLNESIQPQKSHKKAIIAGIISAIILIAATTLIIGYTKFNWFQHKQELYDLDIQLKRAENQIHYYTEKKEIKTITSYNNGNKIENIQNIFTNFMVAITEKKDLMNKATMVILETKAKVKNEEEIINSFNIFDKSVVNEFESNPNVFDYPIVKFSFDDNGKIHEILLPKEMDKDQTQLILGIIEEITPKLKRNKTEDVFSGLSVEVNEFKEGKIKSELEKQSEKVYFDKFTKREYPGSKYKSQVERIIENKEIKSVNSQVNLYLENDKQEAETNINFGFDSFDITINSAVTLTKSEEESKEKIELIEKLSKKYEYIESGELMNSLLKKEEEKEKEKEESKDLEEPSKNLRNLGSVRWEGSFYYEKEILSFKILGQQVQLFYSISVKDGKIKHVLFVKCGSNKIEIGNKGTTLPKIETKALSGEITLFRFPFPGIPIPITIEFIIGGKFDWELVVKSAQNAAIEELNIKLESLIYGKAQAVVGVKHVADITVGVKGDLIKAEVNGGLQKYVTKYQMKETTIKYTVGRVEVFIKAEIGFEVRIFGKKIKKKKTWFNKSLEIYKGYGPKTIKFK